MPVSVPTVKYELNLNTLILVLGFLGTIGTWGITWGQYSERLASLTTANVALATHVEALDEQVRKYDNLAYRLDRQEQGSAGLAKAVEELKAAMNTQGADIRVIREILLRRDKEAGTAAP